MEYDNKEKFNYWPSFVDIFSSLFFIFLIIAVAKEGELGRKYAEERKFSEPLREFRRDLDTLRTMIASNGLDEVIQQDITIDSEGIEDTLYTFVMPDYIVWSINETRWDQLGGLNKTTNRYDNRHKAQQCVVSFGRVLKQFLDGRVDLAGKTDYRYNKYIILIICRASPETPDEARLLELSTERSKTIKEALHRYGFNSEYDTQRYSTANSVTFYRQDKYLLYSAGVAARQLVDLNNPISDRNRQVEIKLIPDFLINQTFSDLQVKEGGQITN